LSLLKEEKKRSLKMSYRRVTPGIISKIEEIVGKKYVLTEKEDLEPYSRDETPGLSFFPEIVVKVENSKQIVELFKLCNKEKIPLTPRGGGTGLTGGAIPVKGGIVLSFERMNKIKDIDRENYMAVVEPGVINGNLQRELAREGLFYPVNPASMDSCTIGGNVAQSSSGANAVKYGGTKEYVSGLEIVTPTQDVIKAGGKLVKNVTDYKLIQLVVGSEGTLAAITEVVLKVIPLPEVKIDLVVGLDDLSLLQSILKKIWQEKIILTSIEYIEEFAVKITKEYVQNPPFLPSAHHYLMIGIDGEEGEVNERMENLEKIFTEENVQDVLVAQDRKQQEDLWKFRQSVREALLNSGASMVEEDIVVPRGKIVEFMEKSKRVYESYSLKTGVYGHLGDGNVHYNFIKPSKEEKNWEENVEKALYELFKIAISLGGKISGEHGIGLTKKKFLHLALTGAEIELLRKVKKAFDPNNILNPGKIFDL